MSETRTPPPASQFTGNGKGEGLTLGQKTIATTALAVTAVVVCKLCYYAGYVAATKVLAGGGE